MANARADRHGALPSSDCRTISPGRLHVAHRTQGIDAADRALQRCGDGRRVAIDAHEEAGEAPGRLRVWRIHLKVGAIDAVLAHVTDHADNLARRRRRRAGARE